MMILKFSTPSFAGGICCGHRFEVMIFNNDRSPELCLEVADESGTSQFWDAQFESNDAAWAAALLAFEDECAEGSLNPDLDVIPCPTRQN